MHRFGTLQAAQFAEGGFDLVVAAEDERIRSAASALGEHGAQVVPVQADLATFDGVEELCQAIRATGRTPEALAVNAGVGVAGDFVRENELADELRLIGLNITGAVHLAKRVLPEMIAAGRGGVLFTSFIAATAPGPYHATYAASKAFLVSFAEALRYELQDTGVTVTALMPGPTDTEFFGRAGMQGTRLREQTGAGGPGGLRGADGRPGQGDRRVAEEQGPGGGRPGPAGDREGEGAGAADQAGQRRPVALAERSRAKPGEGVRP